MSIGPRPGLSTSNAAWMPTAPLAPATILHLWLPYRVAPAREEPGHFVGCEERQIAALAIDNHRELSIGHGKLANDRRGISAVQARALDLRYAIRMHSRKQTPRSEHTQWIHTEMVAD